MGLNADIINELPRSTGVYILRNAKGQIIYIGKAKNIRSRLQSYLGRDTRPYATHIVNETDSIDFMITSNEKEALLLENQLIKAHKPRFNIDLKDDKTYVRVKVTTNNEWPGIYITRRVLKDGSHYFGPYSSVQTTKKTLSAIGRIFPIRRCKDTVFKNRTRPCMYHQIGLCTAPCVNRVSKQDYSLLVEDLLSFLEGRNKHLEQTLQTRMNDEAEKLNYETAARIRDQIHAIRNTLIPQAVVGDARADTDVFGTYRHGRTIQIAVMHIARGILADSNNFALDDGGEDDVITNCILQFYLQRGTIPPLIYTDTMPVQKNMLESILADMRGGKVSIREVVRGRPRQWAVMARENARNYFKSTDFSVLDDIARYLHLGIVPYRMECYDISNLQGTHATASRSVFIGAEPDKSLYRHYRIKDIPGQDDFAMMEQVIRRRMTTDEAKPDLMVIDGGKGQLNVCVSVLDDLGMGSVPVVAIAKARGSKTDRFFVPGRKDPIKMPERSNALRIMMNLRDEAHRFAVRYHRHLRSRSASSVFEEIPGIGPKKARALLKHTSHIEDLSKITTGDLSGCPLISRGDIDNILDYLKNINRLIS